VSLAKTSITVTLSQTKLKGLAKSLKIENKKVCIWPPPEKCARERSATIIAKHRAANFGQAKILPFLNKVCILLSGGVLTYSFGKTLLFARSHSHDSSSSVQKHLKLKTKTSWRKK
jgi:hypothetical protein